MKLYRHVFISPEGAVIYGMATDREWKDTNIDLLGWDPISCKYIGSRDVTEEYTKDLIKGETNG